MTEKNEEMKRKGIEGEINLKSMQNLLENSWNRLRSDFIELIHWLKSQNYYVAAVTNNWILPQFDSYGDRLCFMRSFFDVYVEVRISSLPSLLPPSPCHCSIHIIILIVIYHYYDY